MTGGRRRAKTVDMSLLIKPLADKLETAIELAGDASPFLKRLHERWPNLEPIEQVFQELEAASHADTLDQVSIQLRQAKARGQLAIAAADLSGKSDLKTTTAQITGLADAAVRAALSAALRHSGVSSEGLFVIALGKMGAKELNYSSDIDIAVFYDPEVFKGGDKGPALAAKRVVQSFVRLLDERTEEGYVFRTDLRLRPDPSSTPLAVSTHMAANYYESVGQNWERMVWIKARPVAGDLEAADRFMSLMEPFVWRRHLDYWAISDIHAIKRMINSGVRVTDLDARDCDVKLSPGGIREIEFFAQTQQLILGGRDLDLRVRGTVKALKLLADKNIISRAVRDELIKAYEGLRMLEHRLQMRLDEQTHQMPTEDEKPSDIAHLCGYTDIKSLDQDLLEVRRKVNAIYLDLFADEDRQTSESGNLVFTGVDDDPGTVATLTEYGFSNPSSVIDTIRDWHRGRTPATRNKRGRQLLTALLPRLLRAMAETGNPDGAFLRFSQFFEKLRSGVQTLSMLQARPQLLQDLIATIALAPRLASSLGRRPGLLEALLTEPSSIRLPDDLDFEDAINEMRRRQREKAFLIGHDLLHGKIDADEAAFAYSDLADGVVVEMAKAAERECIRKFGPSPGSWLIAAFGKLGGKELTAESDLDLIVIYDLDDPLGDPRWMTRFTQRLVTALSTETDQGALYEVDLRLRPSGRAGPVAVKLSAFERYHLEEAWTWERMALTRLRIISGAPGLISRCNDTLDRIHAAAIAPTKLLSDVLDMRQRLDREKPGGGWLELKSAPGGLVDIEFIAQLALLKGAGKSAAMPSTADALRCAINESFISYTDGAELLSAHALFSRLQQLQRLALVGDVDEADYPTGLKTLLAKAAGAADFETMRDDVRRAKEAVIAIRERHIGPLS